MEINYGKFNSYSEPTQRRITEAARLFLSMLEIYDEDIVPFSYLEGKGFEYSEFRSLLIKLQEEILGKLLIKGDLQHWHEGKRNSLILKKGISFKYENDAREKLNLFLTSSEIKELEDSHKKKGVDTDMIDVKKIRRHEFPRTDWVKISIHFIDEQNVLVTAGTIKNIPLNYEQFGLTDKKRNKPSCAWNFFYNLAKNGGETSASKNGIDDKIRQYKNQVTDSLKTMFKNDTDPFFDAKELKLYRIKIKLIIPPKESTEDIIQGNYLDID